MVLRQKWLTGREKETSLPIKLQYVMKHTKYEGIICIESAFGICEIIVFLNTKPWKYTYEVYDGLKLWNLSTKID